MRCTCGHASRRTCRQQVIQTETNLRKRQADKQGDRETDELCAKVIPLVDVSPYNATRNSLIQLCQHRLAVTVWTNYMGITSGRLQPPSPLHKGQRL